MGSERPPSQEGVEWRTLDAVEALALKVDELARQRAVLVGHPNWWDVFPSVQEAIPGAREHWSDVFHTGWTDTFYLSNRRPEFAPALRVDHCPDRLEFSIRIMGSAVLWQRAVFYQDPPRA